MIKELPDFRMYRIPWRSPPHRTSPQCTPAGNRIVQQRRRVSDRHPARHHPGVPVRAAPAAPRWYGGRAAVHDPRRLCRPARKLIASKAFVEHDDH